MTEHPTPTPQTLLGRPGGLGTATVIRGNARCLPLPDNSVDLIVSSPPYWSLRAYQDNGETYDGQIGAEPTPGEFVDSLIEVTRELMRVTKPTGSIWINLGDKYAGGDGSPGGPSGLEGGKKQRTVQGNGRKVTGGRPKSLIGLPWRYALRCIDDLGLILRAEIILDKKNGLPESVTDRVRRSHEQVFHFVKEPRYFSAVDEIRTPHGAHMLRYSGRAGGTGRDPSQSPRLATAEAHPLGALPGSVWPYTSEPFQPPAHLGVDHFAAFATALPRQIILGWSPSGVCTGCGQGRRPVSVREEIPDHVLARYNERQNKGHLDVRGVSRSSILRTGIQTGQSPATTITGYACDCAEPTAPTTPSIILDPFGGTGTTAMVAKALGRHGISVDMSADYGRLAKWRTNDLDQLAKVQGIKRSDQARAADRLDMDTLFDFDGGTA